MCYAHIGGRWRVALAFRGLDLLLPVLPILCGPHPVVESDRCWRCVEYGTLEHEKGRVHVHAGERLMEGMLGGHGWTPLFAEAVDARVGWTMLRRAGERG